VQISRDILSCRYDAILVEGRERTNDFSHVRNPAGRLLNMLRPSVRLYAGNDSKVYEHTFSEIRFQEFG
jgi:hypothetical protein